VSGAGFIASVLRSVNQILIRKPEGKSSLGRPRYKCNGNMKMDRVELESEGVASIHVAQRRVHCQVLMNTLNNEHWVPLKGREFLDYLKFNSLPRRSVLLGGSY
jgi:hypothetical protein